MWQRWLASKGTLIRGVCATRQRLICRLATCSFSAWSFKTGREGKIIRKDDFKTRVLTRATQQHPQPGIRAGNAQRDGKARKGRERDLALNQSGYMGSLSGSQQQGRSTRYSPLIRTRRLQAIDGHQCEYNSRPRHERVPRRPQALQCDTGCKASNAITHRQPVALVLGHGF